MPWIRAVFLVAILLSTSGYRWRCYMACTDQTSTQNDYIEQRDYCREYAQLKVNMASREAGDELKSRKATLVSLFSQCMGANGWTVPDGKGDGSKKPDVTPIAAATPVAAVAPAPAPVNKVAEKAVMTRTAECAFARHSASVSSIAKLRAEACDLQCAEGLRTAPNAPRPASCPSDPSEKLSTGNDK
jgi:hypothetical protein